MASFMKILTARFAVFVIALATIAAGANRAEALEVTSQQVQIDVRFLEVNQSTIRDLGFDFGATPGTQPMGLGIANQPADLAPRGFPLGPKPNELSVNEVIRLLETEGLARTLASPKILTTANVPSTIDQTDQVEYVRRAETETRELLSNYESRGGDQPGVANLVNARMNITVPNEAGTGSSEFDVGITMNIAPVILSDRNLVGLHVTGDYVEFEGGQPILDSKRLDTTVTIDGGQSIVISGLFDEGARDAAGKIPLLGDIPIIGALFRSQNFLRNETDLVIIVTPQIRGGTGGGGRGAPAQPASASNVTVSAGAGYAYQGMPSLEWLRTETMFMGDIVQRPLVSADSNFDGAEFQIALTAKMAVAALGGSEPRIGVDFSYFNADISSFTNFIDAEGFGVGVEDGTGGGVFVPNGFGDLFDIRFDASYTSFDTRLMIEEDFDVFEKKRTTLGYGLNVRYSEFDAVLQAVTNGNTLDIERGDWITNWVVAPTVSGRVSHNYGGIVTAYGGVNVSAGIGIADGMTQVLIGNMVEGQLDDTKVGFVYQLGFEVGAEIHLEPVIAKLFGGGNYGNYTPVFVYPAFSESYLSFESDFSASFGATVTYPF